ncbi:MAG: GAF domain-containing protein [Candidatus Omnitrophica bacterium]|nr:GAF domain-containing protein [Candidatus Omnitrophota bacterium]
METKRHKILSKRLYSLFELSKQLFSLSGIERVSKKIMDACLELMGADSGSLMLLGDPGNRLRIVASFGIDKSIAEERSIALGEGIAGWVAQSKKPLILVGGLKKHPLFSDRKIRKKIGSSLCVPLLINDNLKGVINLNRPHSKPVFSGEDLEFVLTLANYLANAIEKEKLYCEIECSLKKLKSTEAHLIQSEKMSSLGYFISGMAHEIRNPLAAVSAEAQYLLMKGKQPKDANKSLETIVEQSDRISDIIERMLSFSCPKRERGKILDLDLVVEKTLKLVSYRMSSDNIRIIKDVPSKLPKVTVDPVQIEWVFLNLILNAHQAMPKGGDLRIKVRPEGRDHVNIKFMDTGEGIPPEKLKSIFEPFCTTREKGTGLGLFISDQIIRSLGGSIDVESKPGEGASFIVRLPIMLKRKK